MNCPIIKSLEVIQIEHYQIIKQLREERGLSQSFLAEGLTTREAVSKFERRGTKISAETLFWFLEKMNITLEEYYHICSNGILPKKQQIIVDGYKHLSTYSSLQTLLTDLSNLSCGTNDPFYRLLIVQFRSLYYWLKNDLVNDNYIDNDRQEIQHYLNGIDTWGRFELSLFNNLLFLFDSDYITATYKRTITKLMSYENIIYYRNDITGFMSNALFIFWQRNDYQYMKSIISDLQLLTKDEDYCFYKITCKTFEKIYQAQNDLNLEDLKTEFDILNYLGYESTVNDYYTAYNIAKSKP